jgi:hypothetical protein
LDVHVSSSLVHSAACAPGINATPRVRNNVGNWFARNGSPTLSAVRAGGRSSAEEARGRTADTVRARATNRTRISCLRS